MNRLIIIVKRRKTQKEEKDKTIIKIAHIYWKVNEVVSKKIKNEMYMLDISKQLMKLSRQFSLIQ